MPRIPLKCHFCHVYPLPSYGCSPQHHGNSSHIALVRLNYDSEMGIFKQIGALVGKRAVPKPKSSDAPAVSGILNTFVKEADDKKRYQEAALLEAQKHIPAPVIQEDARGVLSEVNTCIPIIYRGWHLYYEWLMFTLVFWIRRRLMRNWRSWNEKTPFRPIIWTCSKTLTLKSRSSWTKLIPLWRNIATRPENGFRRETTTLLGKKWARRERRCRKESVSPERWPILFRYVSRTSALTYLKLYQRLFRI